MSMKLKKKICVFVYKSYNDIFILSSGCLICKAVLLTGISLTVLYLFFCAYYWYSYCFQIYRFFVSVKDAYDYQGRSFLHVPQDVGVNLKSEFPPEKCFIPKKLIHTWTGHTKGLSQIRWFPKSAHLLLSASMDSKIKVK